jgi:fumarylacetoacetase
LNGSKAIAGVCSLPPTFFKFPISYTGRTSSIVVSGTPIRRPWGQFRVSDDVVYGPTRQLDYELEVGCIIGKPTARGDIVSLQDAEEHIFGLVLLNDWSGSSLPNPWENFRTLLISS